MMLLSQISESLSQRIGKFTWRIRELPNGSQFVFGGYFWRSNTPFPWKIVATEEDVQYCSLSVVMRNKRSSYICMGGESQKWSTSCPTGRWRQRWNRMCRRLFGTLDRKSCTGGWGESSHEKPGTAPRGQKNSLDGGLICELIVPPNPMDVRPVRVDVRQLAQCAVNNWRKGVMTSF